MNKPILVPTDLTDVASKAIRQAEIIAKKAGTSVTLLHVLNDKSPSLIEVEDLLTKEAALVKGATGKECEILIKEGIDGLEVQPNYNGRNEAFEAYALKKGLFITYGSDYHGPSLNNRPLLMKGRNIIKPFWRD